MRLRVVQYFKGKFAQGNGIGFIRIADLQVVVNIHIDMLPLQNDSDSVPCHQRYSRSQGIHLEVISAYLFSQNEFVFTHRYEIPTGAGLSEIEMQSAANDPDLRLDGVIITLLVDNGFSP